MTGVNVTKPSSQLFGHTVRRKLMATKRKGSLTKLRFISVWFFSFYQKKKHLPLATMIKVALNESWMALESFCWGVGCIHKINDSFPKLFFFSWYLNHQVEPTKPAMILYRNIILNSVHIFRIHKITIANRILKNCYFML